MFWQKARGGLGKLNIVLEGKFLWGLLHIGRTSAEQNAIQTFLGECMRCAT